AARAGRAASPPRCRGPPPPSRSAARRETSRCWRSRTRTGSNDGLAPFDENHLGVGARLAQLLRPGVHLRRPPGLRLLVRRELEQHHPLRLPPLPFQTLGAAAARDVAAA